MGQDVASINADGQLQNSSGRASSDRQNERRPKLLDQMRERLRTLRYAYRTEQNDVMWVEKFLRVYRDAEGRWRHGCHVCIALAGQACQLLR